MPKRPKRLTREQKIFLSERGFNPKNYACLFDTDTCMILVDKTTGKHIDVRKETELFCIKQKNWKRKVRKDDEQ